jgi:hypothetical protein
MAFSSTKGLKATYAKLHKYILDNTPLNNSPGVFKVGAFSSPTDSFDGSLRIGAGVAGSNFLTGACLLPGRSIFRVLSGELYIPKTSASASFVLIVTVGSLLIPTLFRCTAFTVFDPSSLKSTRTVEDEDDALVESSEAGGAPHFFSKRPMDRARDSCMLYSTPSSV